MSWSNSDGRLPIWGAGQWSSRRCRVRLQQRFGNATYGRGCFFVVRHAGRVSFTHSMRTARAGGSGTKERYRAIVVNMVVTLVSVATYGRYDPWVI